MEKDSRNDQNEEKKNTVPLKTKKYWNPGSYRYYIKYPSSINSNTSVVKNSISNKQVKTLHLVSIAFKIAKIVAVVLIALLLIGEF